MEVAVLIGRFMQLLGLMLIILAAIKAQLRVVEGYDVVCETSEASPSLVDSQALASDLQGSGEEDECCTSCVPWSSYCNTAGTSGTAAANVCGPVCAFPTCFLCRDVGIFLQTSIIATCQNSNLSFPDLIGGYIEFFGDIRINLFNSAALDP